MTHPCTKLYKEDLTFRQEFLTIKAKDLPEFFKKRNVGFVTTEKIRFGKTLLKTLEDSSVNCRKNTGRTKHQQVSVFYYCLHWCGIVDR